MEIYDKHKELYHYTDFVGLEGIYTSNILRATHFRDLNDTSECLLMKDVLIERLKPLLSTALQSVLNSGADTATKKIVDGLYELTLGVSQEKKAYCEPYITSFCSHEKDKLHVQQNGLLSQWRGYGGNGGFAIIFDKEQLEEMFTFEKGQYQYQNSISKFRAVLYRVYEMEPNEEFEMFLNNFGEATKVFFENNIPLPPSLYEETISVMTSFKHEAFFEEREVRIIISPIPDFVREFDLQNGFKSSPLPIKPIETREDGKRYISLFGSGYKLPIKRVIVGPSADQDENYKKARNMLDASIEVVRSETPYIP